MGGGSPTSALPAPRLPAARPYSSTTFARRTPVVPPAPSTPIAPRSHVRRACYNFPYLLKPACGRPAACGGRPRPVEPLIPIEPVATIRYSSIRLMGEIGRYDEDEGMPPAEFEEKEYEVAVAVELATGGGGFGKIFSSGQVLEKIVGYDAASSPGDRHAIWRLLQVPRPPGIKLIPNLWDPGINPSPYDLPRSPVSLILQYKRPHYLTGPRAAQWRMWRKPYFRFARTSEQHSVLKRLERRLGARAIVRYAAPAFWQRGQLESAHLSGQVLVRSGFVSPATIGSHRVWTYVEPGVAGRANPSTGPRPFETVEDIVSSLLQNQSRPSREMVLPEDGFMIHLRQVGEAAREREPRLRRDIEAWTMSVAESNIGVSSEILQRLADLASVTSLVARIGATWHVISTDM
jgi:hypothetical protein